MKEKLKTVGSFILWIIIIALYFSGGLHSSKKHHEGQLAWWFPPWGVYRGIEQFWHNDYAGVNWNEKLHSDTKSLFYLIYTSTQKGKDEVKLQSDLEEFRTHIKNYPKDKIKVLKNNANTYISFLKSMDSDFFNLLSGDTIFFKKDFMSLKSKNLLDSVGILSDTMEVNDFKIGMAQAFGNVDTTIYLPSGAHETLISSVNSSNQKLQNIYNDIFKDL